MFSLSLSFQNYTKETKTILPEVKNMMQELKNSKIFTLDFDLGYEISILVVNYPLASLNYDKY